jgi:general secretion pathway protein I
MKGFTLLEVMIALAIMAGVLLTVITTLNYHLTIVSQDREETEAALLLRAKLNEPDFVTLKEKSGTFAPARPDITWEKETLPADFPGVNRLTVTATWGERNRLTLVQYYSAK